MYFEKSASRGQEYPSSQSFAPSSVSGFGASRPTRLPPRGEAGRTKERSTLKRIRYRGGTPAPLSARNGRDARSTWGDGATRAHQTCHSTKRTHFISEVSRLRKGGESETTTARMGYFFGQPRAGFGLRMAMLTASSQRLTPLIFSRSGAGPCDAVPGSGATMILWTILIPSFLLSLL